MVLRPRQYSEIVTDAIEYLSNNTSITYFGKGSMALAFVESFALEIAKLQEFVRTNYDNSFLSTARGPFLDLFGEMMGLPRMPSRDAVVYKEDKIIRFYVKSGTLGDKLPHPTDPTKGMIPVNTYIYSADGNVKYVVIRNIEFPRNRKSVYVDAKSLNPGAEGNVGANTLTSHSLGDSSIKVTNDLTIETGQDEEGDASYRLRLAKSFSTRFSANEISVSLAAAPIPGLIDNVVIPYARGAGTYDLLLIPAGNKLSKAARDETLRTLRSITPVGIVPRVREPEYIPFKVVVKLRFNKDTEEGKKDLSREQAHGAILRYMGSIPMGGEIIINQMISFILDEVPTAIDLKILELCIDGIPRGIRNYKLREDELLVPDDSDDAVVVI